MTPFPSEMSMLERLTRATPPMLNKRGTELISKLKTNMLKIENAERENITQLQCSDFLKNTKLQKEMNNVMIFLIRCSTGFNQQQDQTVSLSEGKQSASNRAETKMVEKEGKKKKKSHYEIKPVNLRAQPVKSVKNLLFSTTTHYYRVSCKSLEPPFIFYFTSKKPDGFQHQFSSCLKVFQSISFDIDFLFAHIHSSSYT